MTIVPGESDGWDVDLIVPPNDTLLQIDLLPAVSASMDLRVSIPEELELVLGGDGPVGSTGAAGIQGPTGPTGSEGQRGVTGPTGPVGPRGLSYGPTGPTGPIGPPSLIPGPQGIRGPTGPPGPLGPTGVQGPTGPAGHTGFPVGSMLVYGGAYAPAGWLICDGRSVLQADYPQLYETIFTRFGKGANPGTTFALPNMVGRLPMGADEATMPMGTRLGARTIKLKLTANQMPSHRHDLSNHTHTINHAHAGGTSGNENADHEHGVGLGGGGHEHVYVQPSARGVVNGDKATGANYSFVSATTGGGGGHYHEGGTGGINRNHQHSVSVPAFSGSSEVPSVNETSTAGGNADIDLDITPPVTAVNWMIKF